MRLLLWWMGRGSLYLISFVVRSHMVSRALQGDVQSPPSPPTPPGERSLATPHPPLRYPSSTQLLKFNIKCRYCIRMVVSSFPSQSKHLRKMDVTTTTTINHTFTLSPTVDIQWVRKVFRRLYIFHSLFHCTHLLKSNKFIFSALMYTQQPILTEKNRNVEFFANVLKNKN